MVVEGLPRINIAGDFIIKAGTQIEPRTIEDYELAYLPNRSGTRYFCGSGAYMLDTPCYIITKPGEEHGYSFDPAHPTRILFIHFDFGGLPSPDDYFTVLQPSAVPFIRADELSFVPNVLKRMFQLMAETGARRDYHYRSLFFGVLEELEAGYAAGSDGIPAAAIPNSIKKALDFIDKHLTSPFSIKEIAYSLKWSHEHFTRMFAKHLGLSPQQVVLQRRIEKACQLLLHESWSVKQVAHSVGFDNEHYFSRAFAKAKGMTATRYREKFADPRLQHLSPIDEYQAPYPLNRYLFFRSTD